MSSFVQPMESLAGAMSELMLRNSSIDANGDTGGLYAALLTSYGSLIQSIPSPELDAFTNVLHWAILAARPLSVNELTAAVTIHAPGNVDEWQILRNYIELYQPLVNVQHDEVILHQSFGDCLLDQKKDNDMLAERIRDSFATAHLFLVKACLDALHKDSPLSDYAKLYWPQHFSQCPEQMQIALITNDAFFKEGSAARYTWWKSDQERSKAKFEDGLTLDFHMACYLGLRVWARMILAEQSSRRHSNLRSVPLERPVGKQSRMRCVMAGKPFDKITCLRSVVTKCFSPKVQPAFAKHQQAERCRVHRKPNSLYYAVLGGSGPEIVSFLLANGSNPNARDSLEESPLNVAAKNPQLDVMKLLLTHGADPDGSLLNTDRVQMTPLCYAVKGCLESLEAVALLLNSGATIQIADDCMTRSVGLTLLQLAASKGSKALIQLLLDHGADPGAAQNGKPVPLCLAIEGGHNKVVNLLLDQTTTVPDVDSPCISWPLYTALACQRFKIAMKIIRRGDTPDNSSFAALNLWSAIINSNVADVRSNVEQGVDPNMATPVSQGCPSGLTSLHWAVIEWQHRGYNTLTSQDHSAIIRELLAHDADAESTDARGKTALQYANKNGSVWKAVERLMARSRETLYNCNLDLLKTGGTKGNTC